MACRRMASNVLGHVVSRHINSFNQVWHCSFQFLKHFVSGLSSTVRHLIPAEHRDALCTELQSLGDFLSYIDESCQQFGYGCDIFGDDHSTQDVIAVVNGAHAGV